MIEEVSLGKLFFHEETVKSSQIFPQYHQEQLDHVPSYSYKDIFAIEEELIQTTCGNLNIILQRPLHLSLHIEQVIFLKFSYFRASAYSNQGRV